MPKSTNRNYYNARRARAGEADFYEFAELNFGTTCTRGELVDLNLY